MSMTRFFASTLLISLIAAALSGCTLRDRRDNGWRSDQGTSIEPSSMEAVTPTTELVERYRLKTDGSLAEETHVEESLPPIASPTPDLGEVLDELMDTLTYLESLLGATQFRDVELP